MRRRTLCGAVVLASAAAVLAAGPGPVQAQTPSFSAAQFAPQSVQPTRVTAAVHMSKDQTQPARAFGGPTWMLADPDDPRTIVVATTELRSRTCQLIVSQDAGLTWHFSKSLPSPTSYPYCLDNVAGVANASLAWGRNGTLYYSAEAFGDNEGGFRPTGGHVSQMLAKSTNLGETWTSSLIEDNRGKPEPAAATYGTALAVDTSGDTDVVYAGYNQHFPTAPPGSPLLNGPVVVATSTDAGKTFSPAVDLNNFSKVSTTIDGQTYPLLFEGFFGGPMLLAHEGTVLAVSGAQIPNGSLPPGQTSNFGASFTFPMPQLIGRSTDQGKTWAVAQLGPPIFSGSGSQTGMGWTPKGGPTGTYVVAYQATPATSSSSGPAQIVVQRSTDDGITWTAPLAVDKPDGPKTTGFYPQLAVAPNGRIDLIWQDDLNRSDFRFNVRYTYSNDGGQTWADPMLITDRPIDFNFGVSFNSDLRFPPGVASANEYAAIAWADTRFADELSQTQDTFGASVQFAPLPPEDNTTLPIVAAVFGGLVVAGGILLVLLAVRKRKSPAAAASP